MSGTAGTHPVVRSRDEPDKDILLVAENLCVSFKSGDDVLPVVKDISFTLRQRETTCIVGESGCGKSVTALALMRLFPTRDVNIEAQRLTFQNQALLSLSEPEMRQIRGKGIAMIFQDPMSALNPLLTIKRQITEGIIRHTKSTSDEAYAQAVDVLGKVRIPDPKRILGLYPFELSGGMLQRVMIASALAMGPSILIADEPTTALDTTIQAQVLALIKDIQRDHGLGIVLITHDFGVVAEVADQVAVMYAGRIVEYAAVGALFDNPKHPYTIGLMKARPFIGNQGSRLKRLDEIPGTVPSPVSVETGCAFATRCSFVENRCHTVIPVLQSTGKNQWAACHLLEKT